jgi:hypothetical protein
VIPVPVVVLDLLHGGGVRYGVKDGKLWIEDDGCLSDKDYELIREHRDAIVARTLWLEERFRSDLNALVQINANTWVRPAEWIPDSDCAISSTAVTEFVEAARTLTSKRDRSGRERDEAPVD